MTGQKNESTQFYVADRLWNRHFVFSIFEPVVRQNDIFFLAQWSGICFALIESLFIFRSVDSTAQNLADIGLNQMLLSYLLRLGRLSMQMEVTAVNIKTKHTHKVESDLGISGFPHHSTKQSSETLETLRSMMTSPQA